MKKGEYLVITAAVFQASVLVFWKYLLSKISQPILMIYWFGLAFLFLLLFLIFTGKFNFKFYKNHIPALITFGLLSALTSFFLMKGAITIGASLSSFIMQFSLFFTLLYSMFGLKEKLYKSEWAGVLLVIIGLFILNYESEISIAIGSLFVLIAALCQATSLFIIKKLLKKIPPLNLNLVRVFVSFTFGIVYALVVSEALVLPEIKNIGILILGVILGPIFVYVFYYSGLSKIKMVKAGSLIRGMTPIFTYLIAFIFLEEVLNLQQTISVLSILAGVYLVIKKKK